MWNKSLKTRPDWRFFFSLNCDFFLWSSARACVCVWHHHNLQNKEAESQKTRHITYCKTPAIIMIKKSAVTSRQEDIFWASFFYFFLSFFFFFFFAAAEINPCGRARGRLPAESSSEWSIFMRSTRGVNTVWERERVSEWESEGGGDHCVYMHSSTRLEMSLTPDI